MSPFPAPTPSAETDTPIRVVAIDGPAGAGKSTVARALATALGWAHLDTGAMFRAVTVRLLDQGLKVPFDDSVVATELAGATIEADASGRVLIDGVDLTARLRDARVETAVSAVAALPAVRAKLRETQRAFARTRATVAEGRDIGTVVFPRAAHKFWLDASVAERARRRLADFAAAGRAASMPEVEDDLRRRDTADATRAVAPLERAPDAIAIDTTGLSVQQVVDRLRRIVEGKPRTGEVQR